MRIHNKLKKILTSKDRIIPRDTDSVAEDIHPTPMQHTGDIHRLTQISTKKN